jgi:hypothetical protein
MSPALLMALARPKLPPSVGSKVAAPSCHSAGRHSSMVTPMLPTT